VIRLIGVLTGSALAIGLLLLVLGVPELGSQPVADETAAPDESSFVVAQQASPAVPTEFSSDASAMEEVLEEPAPAEEAGAAAEVAALAETEAEAAPAVATTEVPDLDPDIDSAQMLAETDAVEQNWYAFWSPFRSRIAADGFVSELSRTAGLDYRVVKLKPGVYEVAVAYTDDADIEDKLTRISAATGLDMSGG